MTKFILRLKKYSRSLHPIIYAAKAHAEFISVHPFIDGNGRVGRLLMNLILLQKKYMIAIIPPSLRREYLDALKKFQVKKNESAFVRLIARMVRETQNDYLRMIK